MTISGRSGMLWLLAWWGAPLSVAFGHLKTTAPTREDIMQSLSEQQEVPFIQPRRELLTQKLQRQHHHYCDKLYLDKAINSTTVHHINLSEVQTVPDEWHCAVAAGRHDTAWLHQQSTPHFQYQHSAPNAPFYYENHGNEAGAYLQFILDHWECLPATVAFVHGHREASWHSEDTGLALEQLRWEDVEYTSLNRVASKYWEWKIGDHPDAPWLEPDPEVNEGRTSAIAATGPSVYNGTFPANVVYKGVAYDPFDHHVWQLHGAAVHAYDKFFGMHGLGPCPKYVKFTCCAQFAVSRARIQGRPLEFYQKALWYIANNDLRPSNLATHRYVTGDVFSVYWGMVFGEPSDYVPKADCSVFRCPGQASSW